MDDIVKDSDTILNVIQRSESIDTEIDILRKSKITIKQVDEKSKDLKSQSELLKTHLLSFTAHEKLQENFTIFVNAITLRGKYIEAVQSTNTAQYDRLVAEKYYKFYIERAKSFSDNGIYGLAQNDLIEAKSYQTQYEDAQNREKIHAATRDQAFKEYREMLGIPVIEKEEKKPTT